MHILHVFGWTGVKRGYLDMPLEAARARYAADGGSVADEPYEAVTFTDSLSLYSVSAGEDPSVADLAEALAATEVRADVTPLAATLGLYAAATDLGRKIGTLFMTLPPDAKRRRGEIKTDWRLYAVTPRLAAALAERGAPVTEHEGLDLWLRPRPSPLRDDPDLQAIAAYSASGQRATPEMTR